MRAEDDATAGVVRRALGSLARVACAFLAIGLLATAGHFAAGARIVRALAGIGFLRHHRLMDDGCVRHDAEYAIVQIDAAQDFAAEVYDIRLHLRPPQSSCGS